jgi:hypothetical protein
MHSFVGFAQNPGLDRPTRLITYCGHNAIRRYALPYRLQPLEPTSMDWLLTPSLQRIGDYCDVYLTHDSMSVRKAHNSGRNHLRNVVDYYQRTSNQ